MDTILFWIISTHSSHVSFNQMSYKSGMLLLFFINPSQVSLLRFFKILIYLCPELKIRAEPLSSLFIFFTLLIGLESMTSCLPNLLEGTIDDTKRRELLNIARMILLLFGHAVKILEDKRLGKDLLFDLKVFLTFLSLYDSLSSCV